MKKILLFQSDQFQLLRVYRHTIW